MNATRQTIVTAASAMLAALLLAPASHARGIDCARARTPIEKKICADPVLRDYDDRIAAAYARNLGAWDGAIAAYVRRDQTTWLRQFRATGTEAGEAPGCEIADTPCIRDEMRARVEDLESGSYANSGVYLAADGRKLLVTPRHANGYALRVFDPAHLPNAHVAIIDDPNAAMWDGPGTMVARMGDGNGLPGKGAAGACVLRLTPAALSIAVAQTGRCGGRNYAGSYRRDLAQTLADYEFELH